MGASNELVKQERAELAQTLSEVGANQPTLCDGWQTQDLLTHMLIRENRPDAAIAIALPRFKKYSTQIESNFLKKGYSTLVDQFRGGPGLVSPFRLPAIDGAANLFEYVIHHEDIRRAQLDWQPRKNIDSLQELILKRLPKFALLALRKSPVGVTIVTPDGKSIWLKRGNTSIELRGEPLEVLLYISGRQSHANVSIHGSPAAIATFERVKFGF